MEAARPSTEAQAPSTPDLAWLRELWEVLSYTALWDVHPAPFHPAQPVLDLSLVCCSCFAVAQP